MERFRDGRERFKERYTGLLLRMTGDVELVNKEIRRLTVDEQDAKTE